MSGCACDNDSDFSTLEGRQKKVLLSVMLINLLTFFMMVFASYLSQSSALLSGTLDNLGDALTYAVSFAVVGAGLLLKARAALFKGVLISLAAGLVAIQILYRCFYLEVPISETMGIAASLNFLANLFCLFLLTPFRDDDINMASVWECSRNDVYEGMAVILAAGAVWVSQSGLPDLLIAVFLLVLFARSAYRICASALQQMQEATIALEPN
jgi:Co/Zn/Cd efflux system component